MSLLASLGLLVGVIVVFATLVQPAYRDINKLRGELASRAALLEEQEEIVAEVENLLAEYQSLQGVSDRISRVLPNREDYPTLLNQIRGLAEVSQLSLESVTWNVLPRARGGSDGGLPASSVLQVSLKASGNYQALKSFLSSLERNIRIMDLVSLAIIPPSTGQNFSYAIVLNTYYQSL